MEIGVILATLLLMVILFIIIRLLLGPLKAITRLFINCGLAFLVLVLVNFVGLYLNFHLPINLISIISVGVLGVPGFALVAFLNFLFI